MPTCPTSESGGWASSKPRFRPSHPHRPWSATTVRSPPGAESIAAPDVSGGTMTGSGYGAAASTSRIPHLGARSTRRFAVTAYLATSSPGQTTKAGSDSSDLGRSMSAHSTQHYGSDCHRLFGHSRIVGLSQVPVSNRAVRPYERRLGSQRPPAVPTVDGMIEASPGVEPEVTRFADGALRPERHEAVRAPGRIRTADFQVRNLALFPLSYEGMVRVPGADPGLPKHRLYRPGNVPPFTTRRGCLTGFEPASTGATSRSLMPSGVRHSTCGGS